MSDFPNISRSKELYKRAGELIPGHTQLFGRRASLFADGVSPLYADHAKGSRFKDVDGNVYLDWVNAVSAIILGHADDVVNAAVKEQIEKSSIFTINSALEVELAEELVATIPSAEMVRYAKAGGEACALAARIARGTTGKDIILFSGYHGWHDWYQSANYLVDPESGGSRKCPEFPFVGIEPIGVPRVLAGTAVPFSYADLNMLEDLLKRHKGEVAAVMMEPMRSEIPPDGYLESVKELAHQHEALLIFDEVSCGWRIRHGGVQAYTGVTPDMTVLAKCMTNGYPMGAVVGSREAMEPASRMFISSSYWSDNIGLVSALTTIRELKRRGSEKRFEEIGERYHASMNDALTSSGLSGSCVSHYVCPSIEFDISEKLIPKANTLYIQEMSRRGIHTKLAVNATLAHTEEDIQQTCQAAAESFEVIKKGVDAGNLDDLLVVDLKIDPFRRLVR